MYFIKQVRDGASQSSPIIDKLCGYAIFPTIQSSGSSLGFRFVTSNSSFVSQGYDMSYTSTDQGMLFSVFLKNFGFLKIKL